MRRRSSTLVVASCLTSSLAGAQAVTSTQFVNGIAVDGASLDLSSGSAFDRRLGFFSDLYYDATRDEWWALSDRGPGGGTLPYDTRVQRFTIAIDHATGRIDAFQVQQTIAFTAGAAPFTGQAPSPTNVLGNAFDPEGIVVDAKSGHLFVSDEYGPSLLEFDRSGQLVRRFTTPANLVPRDGVSGVPNFASDVGNTAGKTTNRGFEGLAISPDGKFVYAMLQSAMLDEGAGNGTYSRIVKFDVATGQAVAQYAYHLESAGQGRGVSSLVALGNDRFLVLERNNRGVGVGATLNTADKSVFQIDLAGATDVSGVSIAGGVLPSGVQPVTKSAQILDLDANTLAALGNKSPEKWEGLAVGPRLDDGRYLLLAGTDNDYSVTQNASGTQLDVWFDFSQADPYASSIQCPLGSTTGCVSTRNGAPATWTPAYSLLPGVLHAYAVGIDGYVSPAATITPEPRAVMLLAVGLSLIGTVLSRRRASGGQSSSNASIA